MAEEFLLAAYLAAVNVVTFGLFAYDKYCATHDNRRVRESTLLIMAAIGGTVGAGAAMKICRHKTRHLKFKFGVPLLLSAQIILIFVTNPGNIVGRLLSFVR